MWYVVGAGSGRGGPNIGHGLPRAAEQHPGVPAPLSTNDALQRYPDQVSQGFGSALPQKGK